MSRVSVNVENLMEIYDALSKSSIEMVTITTQNLEQLMDDSRFLEALKRAGVDNWEGYSEAVEIYREMIN